ncbi:MAG: NAD(+)/NADH kinase [bacterium]|nr:NAD(+)/NADH kinase [bacterium]
MKYFFHFPQNPLDRRGDDVRLWIEHWRDDVNVSNPVDADLIVVAGGDGTLLAAIHKFHELRKPFFGVGRGTVNFMMNDIANPNDLPRNITDCVAVDLRLIQAEFITPRGGIVHLASNDTYIKAAKHSGVARMRIETEQEGVFEVDGDGVIIATPQGSTAYNRNAYGPILPLEEGNLWVLNGICTNKRVRRVIKAQRVRMTFKYPVVGVADSIEVHEVSELVVTPTDKTITLLFREGEPFHERRREL